MKMNDKDVFIQQLRQERDDLKAKADEFFLAHEAFMVQLSSILGLDYTETSEEDILHLVKTLKEMVSR